MTPLPPNYIPRIGETLIENHTGKPFVVLCSCPNSAPRHHTRRYVQANLQYYSLPAPTTTTTTATPTEDTQP